MVWVGFDLGPTSVAAVFISGKYS